MRAAEEVVGGVERRWTVLLGGFLLSLMGGMSYAWGSFVVPLRVDWGWTAAEATLPLTILIVVFAIAMIPAGWLPVQPTVAVQDVAPRDFVKDPVFFLLWLALASVIGGGLTAIGLLTAYGELELQLSPAQAALSISLYALVNGLGRPAAGWFADRVGTVRVMITVYTVQAVVFLALPWVATTRLSLFVCALLLGAGYAVTFALFPVVVAAGFGTKYLGMNYGLVFSAFGFGAITGLMGSWLLDRTGSFTPAFLLAGSTTVVGLLLLVYLRKKLGVA